MLYDKEFNGILDGDLLSGLKNRNSQLRYDESHDMFGLGITTLCYIFNEDINIFYDWNNKLLKEDIIT